MKYKESDKAQLFKEMWSHNQTRGLCYIQDIRHAISNSDQYPYPMDKPDYQHLMGQEAQEKTLNAVIAAIDRVPLYNDWLDPDSISRTALIDYLEERIASRGDEYTVDMAIAAIRSFQIKRKRKE